MKQNTVKATQAIHRTQETQAAKRNPFNATYKTVQFTRRKSILCNFFTCLNALNALIGGSERTVTVKFSFINEKGFIRPTCPYLPNEGSPCFFPGIYDGLLTIKSYWVS